MMLGLSCSHSGCLSVYTNLVVVPVLNKVVPTFKVPKNTVLQVSYLPAMLAAHLYSFSSPILMLVILKYLSSQKLMSPLYLMRGVYIPLNRLVLTRPFSLR